MSSNQKVASSALSVTTQSVDKVPIYLTKVNIQLAPEFKGLGNLSKHKVLRARPIVHTGAVLETRMLDKKEAIDLVTQQKENIIDIAFDHKQQKYVNKKVDLDDTIRFINTL